MIETKKDIHLLLFTAFVFLMFGLLIGFLIGEYNSCAKQGYKYSYDYGCEE